MDIHQFRSRLDPIALVAWLSFVLVPAGVYLAATQAAAGFWPTVAATVFAALALPAAAGRQLMVGRVAAAHWLVVVSAALTVGTLTAHGLSTPVAVAAAGVLAVALLDSEDYQRAGRRRTPN